ncbi:TPM domain-containing protein [Bacillus sp. S3]|uniref:TPM domain-containing protein n=1 Tax=Bacillus sp. S3 TaxID=486398 RepID=UPI00118B3ACF|nr:TPM domain-containing protein [Bacillus sp. S3]QCJ41005.1 TPM domain-containing protein [Bacillus sp. S3]
MKTNRVFSCILVFFTMYLCASTALAEDVQIPAPIGDIYVQDFAAVLTDTERAELIHLGRSIEDQTTAQVAVLTVETIGDRSIEEFANEAFRQYGIGSKKENNGVMLVLAMKERAARIEVGYGLEGRIPDGKAGRILDEYAIPYLKSGQTNKAVAETYKALASEVFAEYGIEGGAETAPTPGPVVSNDEGGGVGIPSWLLVIIVVVVVFLDFKFFGGTLTYLLLSIITRGGGRGGGGGGSRGGGGGSSGGGGASRGW